MAPPQEVFDIYSEAAASGTEEAQPQKPRPRRGTGGHSDQRIVARVFLRSVVALRCFKEGVVAVWNQGERRWRPAMISAAAVSLAIVMATARRFLLRTGGRSSRPQSPQPIALSALLVLLQDGRLSELTYSEGGVLLAKLRQRAPETACGPFAYSSHLLPGSEAVVFEVARKAAVVCRYTPAPRSAGAVLSIALPFLMLFVWYRALRSILDRNEKFNGPKERKGRAVPQVKLADVVCRSKIELAEIVDYLNNPLKYRLAGAHLPRGALLVGPSGTGKTLLARAVAGEAQCTFISASASEFVEVFVGRGASRVRDLFKQARASAPAVLFLDELDALGSRTRSGGHNPNDEYVQTLNQLLTELDGFYGHSDGIVVLAATNRREALDPALLRPGRFDRHISVELPSEDERLEILSIHAAKAFATQHWSSHRDTAGAGARTVVPGLARIAEAAQGLSGAELANIINETVFMALRKGRRQAQAEDLQAALDRALAVHTTNVGALPAQAAHVAGMTSALFRQWSASAPR